MVGIWLALWQLSRGFYHLVLALLVLGLIGWWLIHSHAWSAVGDPSRRRFTLLDITVLVAATAVGLALYRAARLDTALALPQVVYAWSEEGAKGVVGCLRNDLERALPFLAAWTVAVFGLRLVGPRPRMRRTAR
jgi:hypothetical protein